MIPENITYDRRHTDRRDTDIHNQIKEIKILIETHIEAEAKIKPALDELILLYKGSKVIIPVMVAIGIALVSLLTWAKDHLK